jgi:hypothetical protein
VTQKLIKTSVEMEQAEPVLRCAACEAALGEVQILLMARLAEHAKEEYGSPHWTRHWAELPVDTKLQWYSGMFTADMCDTRCVRRPPPPMQAFPNSVRRAHLQ